MGLAVGSSLEDESIIERALISLKHQKNEAIDFDKSPVVEVICASESVQNLTTIQIIQMAYELSERLRSIAPDVMTGITIGREIKRVSLMNSSGFDASYFYTNLSIAITTFTKDGFYGEDKTFSGSSIPVISDEELESLIVLHKLSEKSINLSEEIMPVIFSGAAMGALMIRFLSGVHGGNILKGLSPLKGKLGDQIFSSKLTIRDDGTLKNGFNTVLFDDEGTPAQNTLIIEKGVLKNYLLDKSQAKKMGRVPTGNAFKQTMFSKEIEDSPDVVHSNIVIEGEVTPDEDIISSVKKGLFVNGVMGGHTGNIYQGDFSLNISSGFLIEDGVLKSGVKNIMISGNVYDLFQNVGAIGNKLEVMYGSNFEMGYSPIVLFSNVKISEA